jgi:mono/diheme cytochrome c family protein
LASSPLLSNLFRFGIVSGIIILFGYLFVKNKHESPLPATPDELNQLNVEARTIFAHHCFSCHGEVKQKGGLQLHTKAAVFAGGDEGPVIIAGDANNSELIRRIRLPHGHKEYMPSKGEKLSKEQVNTLIKWVDAGAPWPDHINTSIYRLAPFENRLPQVPVARRGLSNPIDLFVDEYYEKNNLRWNKPIDDRLFMRRVYLDVLGLLPTPVELASFLKNDNPRKRVQLIEKVLAKDTVYAQHWLTFWNDLLRNDYAGTGYITGGRSSITPWLYESLVENKPYDSIVHQLISPSEASAGFIKGIQWRGTINASQRVEMQAAQNVAQVFLGLNLKCASCHNSFISDWKLEDAYGFANIFAEAPLEIYRCDQPTGKLASNNLLFASLGKLKETTDRSTRLKDLAALLVQEKNGRLSRTFVNRLWAQWMGRGLIEPLDFMDNQPWDQDLLDWMAFDFVRNDYDIKKMMFKILSSNIYQQPSVTYSEPENLVSKDFVFQGMVRRRLSAEQFADAISQSFYPVYSDSNLVKKHFPHRNEHKTSFIRASMVKNDPFLTALGRPNRENVGALRNSQSNLIQALEVSNGQVLNNRLQLGSEKWISMGLRKEKLTDTLFLNFLGRLPTTRERMATDALWAEKPSETNIQDLVWAITLLPEFQLIY